jgi:pSer/pThr/pTyr-binding forkhead associated (FHA) protein
VIGQGLVGPHSASAAELKERVEAERAGQPHLILRDGDEQQRIIRLPDDRARLTIGRASECDLALTWDSRASRVHAELERVGPGWAVVDGGLSRNGSFLNGERLHDRRRLKDRDLLRFGETVVLYREPAPATGGGQRQTTMLSTGVAAPVRVSPAQKAVLRALCRPFAEGDAFATPATNNEIAAELYLSLDAVKGHLRALFAKFELEGLPQNEKRLRLVERALQSGAITTADLREDPAGR